MENFSSYNYNYGFIFSKSIEILYGKNYFNKNFVKAIKI